MALADRVGLALVLPTQSPDSNRQGCFNWFRPAEVARGLGEAGSIRAMVAEAVRRFASNPRAIYVVGLSAGGAMAVAMLAAYPRCSPPALRSPACRSGPPPVPPRRLLAWRRQGQSTARPTPGPIRSALPPRPATTVPAASVDLAWRHGHRGGPANARLLAGQWCALHGLAEAPSTTTQHGPSLHETWGDAAKPQVELWTIPAMLHGYPVAAAAVPSSAMMPVGISATHRIARFWRLA